jgi:formate C-acetyltransferase
MLERFAAGYPIRLHPDELIVGSQRFCSPAMGDYYTAEQLAGLPIHGNIGHIVVDYALLLRHGIDGVAAKIAVMPAGVNRTAMGRALEAFRVFVGRHGTPVCRRLTNAAPGSFHEALQLVWLIQIFLHAEGDAAAVSFGRFDQYLWPFLKDDLEQRRIELAGAFELLCSFMLKTCEGDESQNLVVGGEGENELSRMTLRAMERLRVWQPSLSVRIGPATTEAFWVDALALCAAGIGMPSFFNEPLVAGSLRVLGVPADRADDWSIVGCYEATPSGDAYPLTVAGGIALPLWLNRFLAEAQAGTFPDFFRQFKAAATRFYEQESLPEFQRRWNAMRANQVSPFESVCVTGCIESGRMVEEGGAHHNFFGVNLMGIGTLVDSLRVIQELVYRRRELTLEGLREQVRRNFPDEEVLRLCRGLPGRYGTDDPESSQLARELSAFLADLVLLRPLENGVRPYPGLFWFGADIHQLLPATPDGRRDHDYISYGCGPGAFLPPVSPTSLLNAVAALDHTRFGCGNPLTLALNREDLDGERGRTALRHLIEGYFRQGGFHLQINLAGVDELRAARRQPELHRGLLVRISGFSAAFVSLDPRWQEAIVERTGKGR